MINFGFVIILQLLQLLDQLADLFSVMFSFTIVATIRAVCSLLLGLQFLILFVIEI